MSFKYNNLPHEGLLAVDVCGTLYSESTTWGFVKCHHGRVGNRARLRLLRILDPQAPLSKALGAAGWLVRIDIHRALILWTLLGEHRAAMEDSAKAYVRTLEGKKILPVHSRLLSMQASGWRPILISNSLDIVILEISRLMEIPFVASQLEWKEHRCRGRLCLSLTSQKRKHLEEYLRRPLNDAPFSVITDNKSDLDLIAAADPIILVYQGNMRKWMSGYNADFINY